MDNSERAAGATTALAALIRDRLPVEIPSPDQDPWPMIAWGFLARFAGSAEAIAALLPLHKEIDRDCIVRVLYEHVVTLAWIAPPDSERPHRIDLFRKNDACERIKTDNDFVHQLKKRVLKPEIRAQLEIIKAAITDDLPPLPERAGKADDYWAGRIPGMSGRKSSRSFSEAYRVLYRHGSAYVHPTLYGLNRVVTDLENGGKRIHVEREVEDRSPAGMAAVLVGQGLFVTAETFGWPTEDEMDAIFGQYDWTS